MTREELKYYTSLYKRKIREEEGKFLIEGEHLIEEVISSRFYSNSLEKVFIRGDFDNHTLLDSLKNRNIIIEPVESKLFEKLSDTKSPQGIIGVVNIPEENSITDGNLEIVLDNLNDPGNLGTILRTAYWFNVDKVVLGNNSVDVYNSKVLRGSQGAVFNISLEKDVNLINYLNKRHIEGWNIFLTSLDSYVYLQDISFIKNQKYIFVFGNEANGISEELLNISNYQKIKIRSYSECESLNVGITAGIVLNEYRSRIL